MTWTPEQRKKYHKTYNETYRQLPKEKARLRKAMRKIRHDTKAEIVLLMGGKCSRCGFDEHLFGLEFDHKNPLTKKYNPGSLIGTCSKKRAIDYITQNCTMLCANCHSLKTVAYSDNLRGKNISNTDEEKRLFESKILT